MENNINPEMMNNIKNLVDNGNIQDAISQISPEMIQNFSQMLNSNSQNSSSNNGGTTPHNNSNSVNPSNFGNSGNSQNTYSSNSSGSGFDFSSIDINTVLKMKSAMEQMNNKNDPRSNLLYSLKPYLRQNKQDKLDQYVNMLNITKIADVLRNDKKDDKNG